MAGQEAPAARVQRMRPMLAAAALGFAVLAPLLVLLGVVGVHAGWFGPGVGLSVLTQGLAPPSALLGAILGLIALLFALAVPPRRGFALPLAAIVIGALTFAPFLSVRSRAAATPPIHDVATDWREPLSFTPRLMQMRGPGADPVEPAPIAPGAGAAAGEPVAAINARTCPAATPLDLTTSVQTAYDRARRALAGAGLALVTDDRANGALEATATSFWFALKDDVAMRVRPAGAGARVDLRAVSRLGVNDLGADCALVGRLRRAIAG